MTGPPSGVPAGDRPWLAHYAPGVPPEVTVPDRRLPDLVAESAERFPDRPAFIFQGRRWSYRTFWAEAGRFAARLQRDGFVPGDRLALLLPNCPLYPIAYYGALRAGGVVVQLSPLYVGRDLSRPLQDSRPKAIVTLEILVPNLTAVLDPASAPPVYLARFREFCPPLRRPFVNLVLRGRGYPTHWPSEPWIRRWNEGGPTEPRPITPVQSPAQEVAVLQYTGGTTGRPKAAMLSHRNLVANALQCRAWFRREAMGEDVVLASVPFFHVYGMTVALNYPLLIGATIVLQVRPELHEALRLIDRYHPTQFPGVPSMYQAINQHPHVGRYRIRSIQICVSGSAPLPREVARRFEELTGGNLIEGYGLSEASPVTHANPIGGERRDGSIGLPFPNTDQRLGPIAPGDPSPGPGEPGELWVRGPQVMLGYYGRPEETAEVLADGWLRTGDIATLDADGYAFIVDRKKDLAIVGGFKVYPREVEEVLYEHPGVAEAAAIGVPDAELGEVVKAFIVRRPGAAVTEAELIAFVRARIAHYKAPRSVEFRASLPKSAVQKVLRRELRPPTGA